MVECFLIPNQPPAGTAAESNRCWPLRGRQRRKQEVAPAKEISTDAAMVGVVSEIDGIFMFNEEQEGHGRLCLLSQDVAVAVISLPGFHNTFS